MSFEDEHMDVLQNIEFAIMRVYSDHPELLDSQVDIAIESLTRAYTAEQRGRSAPKLRLRELEQTVYDSVKTACDIRLGKESLTDESGEPIEGLSELLSHTPEDIIASLKRIRKSIKLWTKEYGRQGYLNYVKNFFPG